MRSRGLALVLALLVASAPATLALCQLTCAAAADSRGGTHPAQHHSCHKESAPETLLTIAAVPHTCAHTDEVPAACGVASTGVDGGPLALVVAPGAPSLGVVPVEQPTARWTSDDDPVARSGPAGDTLALRV